jgi:hypothetical protein
MTETKKTINPGTYKAKTDDCISSIGFESGFFPETLWELPENAALKKKRKNLNVLQEGDSIHIPEVRKRTFACQTGKAHKFKLKGVPEKLKLRFLKDGEPRKGLDYELEVDGKKFEGKTDDNGVLEHWITPNSKKAKLIGHDLGTYNFSLGGLDPVENDSGARARLYNMGYLEDLKGDENAYTKALRLFQEKNDLEMTGELDSATQEKLIKSHEEKS